LKEEQLIFSIKALEVEIDVLRNSLKIIVQEIESMRRELDRLKSAIEASG